MNLCGLFCGSTPRSIVLWEKPFVSGILMGSITGLILLYITWQYTPLTFFCHVSILTLVLCGVLSFVHPIGNLPASEIQLKIEQCLTKIQPTIICVLSWIIDLMLWRNSKVTGSFVGLLFFFSLIGNCLRTAVIILITELLIFSLPLAYYHNKHHIQPYIDQVMKFINNHIGKIIPPHSKKVNNVFVDPAGTEASNSTEDIPEKKND